MKKLAQVVLKALLSPEARRYETALVILIYEAVRAALGHP